MLNIPKRENTAAFTDRKFTQEELDELITYKQLAGLSLTNCSVTDRELEYIGKLPKLANLEIVGADITDEGLKYLQNPSLSILHLEDNKLTGVGFKYLKNNKKLNCVWMVNTLLNDEGLACMAEIPKMDVLGVEGANVTFEGLMAIAGNPILKVVGEGCFTKKEIEQFEAKQRELARKKKTVNPQDVADAEAVLQSFFDAYTEWEKFANKAKDTFGKESQEKYKEVLTKFASEKRLKEGTYPESVSGNAPYYSFNGCKIVDTEQLTKNKIYFYLKNQLDSDYRILLVRSGDTWKVEARQVRFEQWTTYSF